MLKPAKYSATWSPKRESSSRVVVDVFPAPLQSPGIVVYMP